MQILQGPAEVTGTETGKLEYNRNLRARLSLGSLFLYLKSKTKRRRYWFNWSAVRLTVFAFLEVVRCFWRARGAMFLTDFRRYGSFWLWRQLVSAVAALSASFHPTKDGRNNASNAVWVSHRTFCFQPTMLTKAVFCESMLLYQVFVPLPLR